MRVVVILGRLQVSVGPKDMDLPGWCCTR